ncbi:hypothetical protein EYZ11_007872 [Aspergillus tanneri]|uniref:Uncharacterized protein n=1 Tax=Aspergillus tanneri TaxID=1220188 RepID=A0A4S3JC62_9EURO|nr:hypothetical protein EYZ11_007872 [Aspergillus tanneri]
MRHRNWHVQIYVSPVDRRIRLYLCAETDDNALTISVRRPGHRLTDIDTRNNLYPASRTARVDMWNNAGSLPVSGFYLDVDTLVLVSTDEICLPLEVFVDRGQPWRT